MSINTRLDVVGAGEIAFWRHNGQYAKMRAATIEAQRADLVVNRERILCAGEFGRACSCSLINPGVLVRNGGYSLLLRGEPNDSTWLGDWQTSRATPLWCELDTALSLREQYPLELKGFPSDSRPEDWRLFEFHGGLYSNHALYFHDGTRLVCRPAISTVDPSRKTVTLLQVLEPPFGNAAEEKNWVVFEHNGELLCVYSFRPFVLLRITLGLASPEVVSPADDSGAGGVSHETQFIGNSTNPVPWDEDHLIMFLHDYMDPDFPYQRNRLYRQYVCLIGRSTLRPVCMVPDPLLIGGREEGRHPGVHYTSALTCDEDYVRAFYGEADTNTGVVTMRRDILEQVFFHRGVAAL